MNCLEFKEQIFAYLDNELDSNAARQFRAHMAGCAACREEVRQYELMPQAVHSLPERECPEELSLKIRAAIEAERNKQKIIPLYKKPWMKYIAAAAAFMLVVGGGSIIFNAMFAANSAAPESMKSQGTADYVIMADKDISVSESANDAATGLFSTAYSDSSVDDLLADEIQIPEAESKHNVLTSNEPQTPMAPDSAEPESVQQVSPSPAATELSQPLNEPGAPMPQPPAETVPASTKEELERAKAVANVRLLVKNEEMARQELAQIAKNLKCAAEINEDGLFCIELKLLDYDAAYKAISEMQQLVEIEKFISRDKIGDIEYTILRIFCETSAK